MSTPREDLIELLDQLALDMARAEVALGEMAATPGVKDYAALRSMACQAGAAVSSVYQWVRIVKKGGPA